MKTINSFPIFFYFIFLSCFGPSQSYPTMQQIAFQSARDGNFEIYLMDIDGSKGSNGRLDFKGNSLTYQAQFNIGNVLKLDVANYISTFL